MKKSKFISLADIVEEFANSEHGMLLKAKFDYEKAQSPARFARKHDYQAMQAHMAADANFSCAMQRFQLLTAMRKHCEQTGKVNSKFDEVFQEYQQYTVDAADFIRQYRERIAILDQAIIDEDNAKII